MAFRGIPVGVIEFYQRLEADNSKSFWEAQAAKRVRDVWRSAEPMNDWLDAHVGPSALEPDGFSG